MCELTAVDGNPLGAPDSSERTICPHLDCPDYVVLTAFDDNAVSLEGIAGYWMGDREFVGVGWAEEVYELTQGF